jgi:hypothetical protein
MAEGDADLCDIFQKYFTVHDYEIGIAWTGFLPPSPNICPNHFHRQSCSGVRATP